MDAAVWKELPVIWRDKPMSNIKNTLGDLNNHLFEMMERLNDDDLTDEQLERELRRAEGMTRYQSRSSGTESYNSRPWFTWMNTDTTRIKRYQRCLR